MDLPIPTGKQMMYGQQNFKKMKKTLLFIIILSTLGSASAQDSTFSGIPIKNWQLKIIGLNNYYPTYLADPLGIRFEASSQIILYSDFDYQDPINDGNGYLGKLVINPGVRVSLLKFSPKSNPKIGIELDFGVTIPVFMRKGNNDVIGVDGIYYFAIAGKPTEWLSLRFSKHHICTHVGDEFFFSDVDSPVDFDPLVTQLPVRDDFILSAAVRPLYFLKDQKWDILQVYGDLGFFFPGGDFMGTRQNKPHKTAWFNFQGGLEAEYYFPKEYFGGVFTALNVSTYQLNAYSPNISIAAGYIFPQPRNKRRARIGFNYYNGRSWSNQFYNRKEKLIAFYIAMDV